jgi:hypothetical protein
MNAATSNLYFFKNLYTGELASASTRVEAEQYFTNYEYKEISRMEHQLRNEKKRLEAQLEDINRQLENGSYIISE